MLEEIIARKIVSMHAEARQRALTCECSSCKAEYRAFLEWAAAIGVGFHAAVEV